MPEQFSHAPAADERFDKFGNPDFDPELLELQRRCKHVEQENIDLRLQVRHLTAALRTSARVLKPYWS